MSSLDHLKENKGVYGTALAVVAMLGGAVTVTLPADEAIAEVRIEMAQGWQQQSDRWDREDDRNLQQDIDEAKWRMNAISNEINRLNSLPEYLGRELNAQELWQLDQLKIQWSTLQNRVTDLQEGY